MLKYKGLRKLVRMGLLICNMDCHHCPYEHALRSTGGGIDVYKELFRSDAISAKQAKQYREAYSALEEEHYYLDARCNKLKEQYYKNNK